MRGGVENEVYLNVVDEMSRVYPGDMTGREFLELVQEAADGLRVDSRPTDQPGRVFIETGRLVELLAFLKHSTASSGVLIIAEPPPALLTCLSGQPKFKSTPKKPKDSSA